MNGSYQMKRILASVLIITFCLFALVSCDLFPEKKRVSCKEYENCAVFTLDYFEGSYSVELSRTCLGEGAIYYQINLEHGRLTVNYKDAGFIHSEQPLGDFTADAEMPIISSGGYIEGDKIEISFGTLSPVKGEIIIAFTEDDLKAAQESIQHEHTGMWRSNATTHCYQYTCGCPSPDIAEMHLDGDGDGACDVCGYEMYFRVVNDILRNQDGCEWLNEITVNDIAEVKIISEAVGVAPGSLKNVSTSTDKAAISRIFDDLFYCQILSVSKEKAEIDGGAAVTVKLILKDGTERKVYINNGNYRDTNGNYYKLLYVPKFDKTDNVTEAHEFITYKGTGTLYDKDNVPVCEIPISELEFVEFDGNADAEVTGDYYTVETDFGTLYFPNSNYCFYLELDDENTQKFYKLVGKKLDELIAEYSVTTTE